MPTLEVDGVHLRYREDGAVDAPALVLSNSLGADLGMWDAQVAALSSQFRVIRYDTRGHGGSAVTAAPYRIETLARDLLALLDALEVGRFRFCGLSMGGMTGMWLGVHAPERVERLALCNTAAKIGSAEMWNARIAKVREGGMAAISQAVLERWFTQDFIATAGDEIARMRAMMESTPPEGYAGCCAAIRDADFREDVAAIGVPTLVIAGAHDGATTPADGRSLDKAIRDSAYVELPAAHLSNVEAAPPFNRALLAFMTN